MSLSLKNKFIGASLFSVLIMAGSLTWMSAQQLADQTQININARSTSVAKVLSKGISDWMTIRRDITHAFAAFSEKDDVLPFLQLTRSAGGFEDIYMGTPAGVMLRTRLDLHRDDFDPRTRPWYRSAKSAGKQIITSPYIGAITKQLMITIAEPVLKNGNLIGIIGADVSLSQLLQDMLNTPVGDNANTMLIDMQSGSFVAHPNENQILKPTSEFFTSVSLEDIKQAASNGERINAVIAGQDKLFYFANIANSSWVVVIEMDKATEEMSYNALLQQLLITAIVITILVFIAIASLVTFLFRDLSRVSQALAEIASGDADLTQRLEPRSDDEVGQLAHNFNRFVINMHTMVSNLRQVSSTLTQQAEQIATQAKKRSTRIQHQQDETNMVATAINQMVTATQDIATNADNTARISAQAVAASDDGVIQVSQSLLSITNLADDVTTATDVIYELNTHAQSINTILSTIQNIAGQTNLLALNAAIEAARAGEQGRGFAVVADEVRVLSQRTHASTQEIQLTIETLQQATARAVGIMAGSRKLAETSVDDANAVSNSLTQINDAVSSISDMATQIASAAEEQSSVTIEITRNTEVVRNISAELTVEAEDAAGQASLLSGLSLQMQQEISRFKL